MAGKLMLAKLGASVLLHMGLLTGHLYCPFVTVSGFFQSNQSQRPNLSYDLALEIGHQHFHHILFVDVATKFHPKRNSVAPAS